jgi:hypothetical protein
MKKNILLFALFFAICCSAFSQRMILLEEGTNTSCGPCASANPEIDALITNNPDKVIGLKYHAWWPGVNDPFYIHNEAENKKRINYYSINAVPAIAINGSISSISYFNQETIDQLSSQPAMFDMVMYTDIDKNANIITVNAIISANEQITNLSGKLFVAVVENLVTGYNAPNGETSFHDVFVKFLTNSVGNAISANWEEGDYQLFQFEWNYSSNYIYNEDQLDIRAFIQNYQEKTVYVAARGNFENTQGRMPFDNDMEITNVSNIPEANCLTEITPAITIRNNGNNTVTSATISYNVNGETTYECAWTGNLAPLETITVTMSEMPFTIVESDNVFNATITNVNNSSDDYPKNNSFSYVFQSAENTEGFVKIFIRTDKAPTETTWKIKKISTGEIIAEGGPYDESLHVYTENVALEELAECYTFTIYDAGGNGICCSNGSGIYGIETNDGVVIQSGGEFTDSESCYFTAHTTFGINNISTTSKIYPNPANENINVNLFANNSNKASIEIFSISGTKVFSQNYSNLNNGENNININVKQLPAGMYIITLKYDDKTEAHKISIN